MPDSTTTPPKPSDQPAAKRKARAEQDQQMANDITAADELLTVAKTDAEIGPLMAAKGYDATELADGVALQTAAQGAYSDRQKAIAELDFSSKAFGDAEVIARKSYADFRETARVKFSSDADQAALGLNGAVPKDLQKFITTANASYVGAQAVAYGPVLTKAGYAPAALVAALLALKALATLHTNFTTTDGNATKATDTRDTAYKKMAKWVGDYRRLGKIALRAKPGLLSKIGA